MTLMTWSIFSVVLCIVISIILGVFKQYIPIAVVISFTLAINIGCVFNVSKCADTYVTSDDAYRSDFTNSLWKGEKYTVVPKSTQESEKKSSNNTTGLSGFYNVTDEDDMGTSGKDNRNTEFDFKHINLIEYIKFSFTGDITNLIDIEKPQLHKQED